jgi:glycosyltransferase involved in cell wall biosynthesis
MSKYIFVNAIAAIQGGALTILNQFIDAIEKFDASENKYVIFCSEKTNLLKSPKIILINLEKTTGKNRLYWDWLGMKKWAKENNIYPNLIFSLQNTGVFFPKIPQIIYLHNSIPFYKYRWSFFKKEERVLWFYKYIYVWLIKITIFKNTELIVQAHFMKEMVYERLNFPLKKITVAAPDVQDFSMIEAEAGEGLSKNCFHFFYPSSTAIFKNHLTLIKACYLLLKMQSYCFKLHLTCKLEELDEKSREIIFTYGLESLIEFHGVITFTKVIDLYKNSDALLFPSIMETVGLPLLEAASIGKPIIATNLPYAQEALDGYKNCKFIDGTEEDEWAVSMNWIINYKSFNEGASLKRKKSQWSKVLDLITNTAN